MRKGLSILFSAALFSACGFVAPVPEGMELPSVDGVENLRVYQGYTSAYNTTTLIPDWVAYELTADELTEGSRDDQVFSMDRSFRGKQARREDYSGSGWTKGHMAPAGDFFWNDDALAETFYFMNVCPQSEELNRKDWNYLEKQVRKWAREYGKVWVACGPIIGENKYGTIGSDKVVVPDAFFKAVMVRNGSMYSSIAFVMGNDRQRYYLADCAMSVNELEDLTGLDFFPALPDDIEDLVEEITDFSVWGIK